jgi:hypothetical protein
MAKDKGPGTSGAAKAGKTRTDENIGLGAPVHAADPIVPKSLYGKKAAAVLGATIEPDGTFADLWALGGDKDFEDAALDAVHQWRYTSVSMNGRKSEQKVFITFVLDEGHIKTTIESDSPFPAAPKRPTQELYSSGELFPVDPAHMQLPKAVFSPDPDYTEAARVAKRQGTVLLGVILGRDGSPEDVWVISKFVDPNDDEKIFRPLGLGLEQKAVDAVRQWKFEPAMKNGKPVPVFANIKVSFRVY